MPGKTRSILLVLIGFLIGLAALVFILGCSLSGPRYQGPPSDHFDGARFFNQQFVAHRSFSEFLRWMWIREPAEWEDRTNLPPGPPPPPRVGDGRLRVTFVNHATVLLQMDGLNILTDPIWSQRASPFSWLGPRRYRSPGIRFEDLPAIDVVVISHNHYDHLDLPTLKRLHRQHRPLFVVGLGNAALLKSAGIDKVKELDWWQELRVSRTVRLVSTPAQHFSARGLCNRDATLWAGYVIEGPAGAVYFAGDTGFGPHFAQIRQRFGLLRLAILPIGAYRPAWFMGRIHLSPAQAVRAHDVLAATTSLAMHYGTFRLADDGQDQPLRDLAAALDAHTNPKPRFWTLAFGEGQDVP
jgi:L-ascorbate metabolism protein UlaG (beta-lactamase superfamily)